MDPGNQASSHYTVVGLARTTVVGPVDETRSGGAETRNHLKGIRCVP